MFIVAVVLPIPIIGLGAVFILTAVLWGIRGLKKLFGRGNESSE
jgi:hypothetical protein